MSLEKLTILLCHIKWAALQVQRLLAESSVRKIECLQFLCRLYSLVIDSDDMVCTVLQADIPDVPMETLVSGLVIPVQETPVQDDPNGPRIVLDWKGDPMTINPGDNMPFF